MFKDGKMDVAWGAVAAPLGLSPYLPCDGYSEGDSFRQLHSRLGARAQGPGSVSHVLAGTHEGVRVMLAIYLLARTFSDAGEDGTEQSAYWTAVVAELDPPLYMGVRVGRSPFLARFLDGDDIQLGIAEADKALHIAALDAHKARALLTPSGPGDQEFLASVVKGVKDGLFFTDSTVGFKLRGRVTDPATLQRFLTATLWYRGELLKRGAPIGLRPHEQQARAEWAAYGAGAGLELDASQLRLHGVLEGIPIEVALEGAPRRLQTAIRIRWPRPAGVQLRVTKFTPKHGDEVLTGVNRAIVQVLNDLVVQDIRVKDTPFDDAFRVQGYPEHAVQQALASPALRANLVAISKVAQEINMTDEGLAWFIASPTVRAADLDGHVRMAVQTGLSLDPKLEPPAGYR